MEEGVPREQFLNIVGRRPDAETLKFIVILENVPDKEAGAETGVVQPVAVRGAEIPLRQIHGRVRKPPEQRAGTVDLPPELVRILRERRVRVERLHRRSRLHLIGMEQEEIRRAPRRCRVGEEPLLRLRFEECDHRRRRKAQSAVALLDRPIRHLIEAFRRPRVAEAERRHADRLVPEREEPAPHLVLSVAGEQVPRQRPDQRAPPLLVLRRGDDRRGGEQRMPRVEGERRRHERQLHERVQVVYQATLHLLALFRCQLQIVQHFIDVNKVIHRIPVPVLPVDHHRIVEDSVELDIGETDLALQILQRLAHRGHQQLFRPSDRGEYPPRVAERTPHGGGVHREYILLEEDHGLFGPGVQPLFPRLFSFLMIRARARVFFQNGEIVVLFYF